MSRWPCRRRDSVTVMVPWGIQLPPTQQFTDTAIAPVPASSTDSDHAAALLPMQPLNLSALLGHRSTVTGTGSLWEALTRVTGRLPGRHCKPEPELQPSRLWIESRQIRNPALRLAPRDAAKDTRESSRTSVTPQKLWTWNSMHGPAVLVHTKTLFRTISKLRFMRSIKAAEVRRSVITTSVRDQSPRSHHHGR